MLHDLVDVSSLVGYLRLATRTRPVVVLTVAAGQAGPYVKAQDLARVVGHGVDIVTIPTDDLTRVLSERLDDSRAGVFRGACRVYPPGEGWERDPMSNPLRMTRNRAEIAALRGHLVRDVKQAQAAATRARPRPRPKQRTASSPPPPSTPRLWARTVPRSVATAGEAEDLAGFLHGSARRMPAVVVSRAAGTPAAYADVEQLEADLDGIALVFEITTLEASWAFSHAVPDGCQVYGGAGRTYPAGTGWELDPYAAPLHFAYSPADRDRITRELAGDAMRMASSGSLSLPVTAAGPVPVEGEVYGLVAQRALVTIHGNQRPGVVWPELVEPGVAAERLFAKDMPIQGVLDPDSRRIDVRGMRRSAADALTGHPGDTILVRVAAVEAGACVVEPFPGHRQRVSADNVVEDATDLRTVLTEGEVVAALLVEVDHSGEWLLSIAEAAETSDAVPAPSILLGGPAWLVPDAPRQTAAETTPPAPSELAHASQAEESLAVPTAQLVDALKQERDHAVSQLQLERDENLRLTAELQDSRAQLRRAKRRRDRSQTPGPDDTALFDDPADQLDFEIRLAWARMTGSSEKKDRPLKPWTYGPDFLETLRTLEGISRDKVVEVIVHVLTGRDTELASRELHPLRTGAGAGDPTVVRDGGETCWRVYLQSHTPSARRLHYWSCTDGSIELSSVRLHDDYRP